LKQESETQLKFKIYCLGHDMYSFPVRSFHILDVLSCESDSHFVPHCYSWQWHDIPFSAEL